jgi:AraC family transcriptional regulator, positive regulator of tynA and feaB
VVEVISGGQRFFRGRGEIARSPGAFYVANVQIQGTRLFRRREQESALSFGDVLVIDALREWELDVDLFSRSLAIRIPKEWITSRVGRPDLIHGTVLRRTDPVCRLFTSYLVNGFEAVAPLPAETAAILTHHSIELLAEALRGSRSQEPAPSSARREALFVRACRLIGLRYGDSHLGPDQIAHQLGVSTRLLQKTFAEHGETIARRLWDERVRRAAKLLTAAEAAHRSITDIGYSCGFNDSAHFARAFGQRMDMTPSQWRKRAQQ